MSITQTTQSPSNVQYSHTTIDYADPEDRLFVRPRANNPVQELLYVPDHEMLAASIHLTAECKQPLRTVDATITVGDTED